MSSKTIFSKLFNFQFDTIIAKVERAFSQMKRQNSGFKKGKMFGIIALVFILAWLSTGFRKVNMEQLGVVLRFGTVQRVIEPGLHYCLPSPIDKVILVDATSVRRIDSANENTTTLVLTGDENIAAVHFYVLWNVKDPVAYLFNAKSPDATVKAASDSIMRAIIAQNPFDKILTVSRDQIAQKAHAELQSFADKCALGIQIIEVQLGKVDPPSERVTMSEEQGSEDTKQECVIEAYREVQRAKADFERSRNEAESYENYIIPTSRGNAEKLIQDAQGYAIKVIAQAEGEAKQFCLLARVYEQNPELVSGRLVKEYKQNVLTKANQIVLGEPAKSTPVFNINSIPVQITKDTEQAE